LIVIIMAGGPHLWLRAETKADEHRSALTPSVVAALIQHGVWAAGMPGLHAHHGG
jgi:NAD/NADP transhydrogenase alpha subunit